MRAASRRSSGEGGFSLLLMVVLLVGVMVLATAGAALAVRESNQRRQIETQNRLKTAYTAAFGGLGFRGPSLRTHCSFAPATAGAIPPLAYDLASLTSVQAVQVADPAQAALAVFNPATPTPPYWNGPYWHGSVDAQNRPLDAWGRPLLLRYITNTAVPGWQFFSLGANGRDDTGNAYPCRLDDQAYPNPPGQLPPIAPPGPAPSCAKPTITFYRDGHKSEEDVVITLTWAGKSVSSNPTKFTHGKPEGNPPPQFVDIPKLVPITVSFVSNRRAITKTYTFTLGDSCTLATPLSF
jgi:hypothetical protein